MMQKIQRFGGAMFTPVLLFAFSGIMVGFAILFKNPDIIGSIATEGNLWFNFWTLIEEGAWTVFRQLPLLFVVGLPISLAKKQQARACMEALVVYLMFNYFLSSILNMYGTNFGVDFTMEVGGTSGLALIAGIKTLDMGMIGAIAISGIVVYLHNKFFDVELPEWLGTFRGSSFVVMIAFFVMIPVAILSAIIWPKVQAVIASMQTFFTTSGVFGVWAYTFLERMLIPTGLHHFIYSPFVFDSAVVQGGINVYWATHLGEFANSTQSLREAFPAGGFALHGMSKVFGCSGIALAIYSTAKPHKKKLVAGLLIPATLTAVVAGITEPLEFTFLFIAPMLFVVHALLAATLSAICFALGLSGNFGSGLIEWLALNWLPLFKNYSGTYIMQVCVGLIFTGIYFVVFRFLILKFNFKTPGREDENEEVKLHTKQDYKDKKASESGNVHSNKAIAFLKDLGGASNIVDVANCATRLRISVADENLLESEAQFKVDGALGLVRNGKAIQVIVGLSVPNVREEFEAALDRELSKNK